jgi:hypothetical protein
MMSKLAQSFVLLSALAAIALAPSDALAGEVKDSGSMDLTYVKRDAQPIPDQEGHMLLLTESSGKASNPSGLVDRFSVNIREIADLRQGNGPHQGYVIFSKGPDQEVVRFEGTISTTMKEGQPNTTMKGTYEIVSATGALTGAEGHGTYTGHFTSEDSFRVDWEGVYTSRPKEAVAEN